MKQLKSLIAILLFFFNYCQCQENENNIKDKVLFIEKVNNLETNKSFSINSKLEHKETIIEKYKKGLLYNYQKFYNKDRIKNYFYFYDKFGNKVLEKDNDKVIIKTSYKYDKKKNIIFISEKYLTSSENYITEYKYNSKNQIIYEKPLNNKADWILLSFYLKNKRLDTLIQKGKRYLRNSYTYDKDKLLIQKSVFNSNNKLNYKIDYLYNKLNNILEEKTFYENTKIMSITKWKYIKYDKFNNWIERYCYYGKIQIHEIRKIDYVW